MIIFKFTPELDLAKLKKGPDLLLMLIFEINGGPDHDLDREILKY